MCDLLIYTSQCSILNPPENIRKLRCFQGNQKGTLRKNTLIKDYVACLGVSQEYLSIHPTLVAQVILT